MSFKQKIAKNIREKTFKRGLGNLFKSVYKEFKYANFHHFLNKSRLLIKNYEGKIPCVNENFEVYANYFLDKRIRIDEGSVVYSFGILDDVDFELELVKKNNCTVHLFDPTPLTIDFMKQYEGFEKFKYVPIGLWNEDKVLTFYFPKQGGSASAVIDRNNNVEFKAPCYTLTSIMSSLGHKHIDLLKMDIEGAALPAMQHFFSAGVYPEQIVAEFENPGNDVEKTKDFLKALDSLNELAGKAGYEIHQIPRKKHKYYAVELIYSRFNR